MPYGNKGQQMGGGYGQQGNMYDSQNDNHGVYDNNGMNNNNPYGPGPNNQGPGGYGNNLQDGCGGYGYGPMGGGPPGMGGGPMNQYDNGYGNKGGYGNNQMDGYGNNGRGYGNNDNNNEGGSYGYNYSWNSNSQGPPGFHPQNNGPMGHNGPNRSYPGSLFNNDASSEFGGSFMSTSASTAPVNTNGPVNEQQIVALANTSRAIIQNAVSTSKKKKALQKAEAAKQRKLMNPLTGEALMKVQFKNMEVDQYHDGQTQKFVLGDNVTIQRTPEATLRKWFGVRGLDLTKPHKRRKFKYSVIYDIQIQNEEEEFTVVARLCGNEGENMRNIVRTNREIHLKLSGAKDVPLTIKIDTDSQEAYEYSMKSIESILRKVYLQLDAWAVDKDNVGKNISLEIRKFEENPIPIEQSVLPENQLDGRYLIFQASIIYNL